MNPVIILVPAAALIVGPRLWVNHVLRQHNQQEGDFPGTARELAREVLDRHQLQGVRVESTDIGDHYDPEVRAVRLARDKIDRKTLTAITTAAHEVSHALQHAAGYPPFLWRRKLAKVARVVGEAGMVLLLASPAIVMVGRQPLPPRMIGTAAFAMLGTGMVAQLSALPTELNASFGRALPILEDGYVRQDQLREARKILVACSLTYITSSMVAVLNIWPWLPRRLALVSPLVAPGFPAPAGVARAAPVPGRVTGSRASREAARRRGQTGGSKTEQLIRRYGKPLIRSWVRHSRGL
ncbi:MAG: zinc metallopeptidase [Gammaproteobacteria bacterium]